MKAILLTLALLIASPVMAAEFNPFDFNDSTQQRHQGALFMAYGTSMTLYAAGVKPEYAAPIGFGVTVLAEHIMHNGRHGMTRSELQMIGIGAGASYITEKGLNYFGLSSHVEW